MGALLPRNTQTEDLKTIITFPKNKEENFYLFNQDSLTLDVLKGIYTKRFGSTSFWDEGKLIGYANFYRYKKDPKDIIYLGNVVVSSQYRGKGYSKEIIKTMIKKAKDEFEASELRLAVFCNNKIAYNLYRKMGFKLLWQESRINPQNEKEPICIMGKNI